MKRWLLLMAAALTSGCGTTGKPPLPRFATGEAPTNTAADAAWTAKLRQADVIYFSLTKSRAAENEPVWRVVETLQQSGEQVALGWTTLSATQQPLLDQWQRQGMSTRQLLAGLDAPVREDWARRALRPDLLQVALGGPRELLRKVRDGETLSPEERGLLPPGFRPRPDGFDNFADRISASPRLRRYDFARLYRMHLAAEQMIAENIVGFRHEHAQARLLVFLPNDMMIDPREVAEYVAQKASLRQMILDRSGQPNESRPQLLARRGHALLQVVDRAPGPARDDG